MIEPCKYYARESNYKTQYLDLSNISDLRFRKDSHIRTFSHSHIAIFSWPRGGHPRLPAAHASAKPPPPCQPTRQPQMPKTRPTSHRAHETKHPKKVQSAAEPLRIMGECVLCRHTCTSPGPAPTPGPTSKPAPPASTLLAVPPPQTTGVAILAAGCPHRRQATPPPANQPGSPKRPKHTQDHIVPMRQNAQKTSNARRNHEAKHPKNAQSHVAPTGHNAQKTSKTRCTHERPHTQPPKTRPIPRPTFVQLKKTPKPKRPF
jgi:hypothetical protein